MVFLIGDLTLPYLTMTDEDSQLRTTRVTTWFNRPETQQIDQKRGHYGRAEYLRATALDKELARAPDPVCRDQWAELGHIKSNVAQLLKQLNFAAHANGSDGGAREAINKIGDINSMLDDLRTWLAGSAESTVKRQ